MGRILDEYIKVDDETINKCLEEFSYSIDDRKKFLDEHVFERLKQYNSKYISEFNDDIEMFKKSIENMKIDDLTKTIKKFTRYCSSNLYKYEMLLFDMLEDK